jgi:hypothetical protein
MGCKDCERERSLNPAPTIGEPLKGPCIIPPCGPVEQYFTILNHTAQFCVPGPCGKPIIHDNGDIEYVEGEPPCPLGYASDSSNPRVFHPDLKPCQWRVRTITFPDGCLHISHECIHPNGTPDCLTCSVR